MASNYQEQQRDKAVTQILSKSPIFEDAEAGVFYKKKVREFILKDNIKNLFESIRIPVVEYFRNNGISWWGGIRPTGHVLSSQIACLNHLFLIRNDLDAVTSLLHVINPDLIEPLTISTDKYSPAYIQFEAVSDVDNLNELYSTRGSNCTSIDALIYARHKSGEKWLIPVEWKYTEFYNNQNKALEGFKKDPMNCKGMVRQNRYKNLILKSKQLQSNNLSCFYYEPFYQLMRQTLWVEQMIKLKNQEALIADNYIHVHVIPSENSDLLHKTYRCSGMDMETTWRSLIIDQSKYRVISPQILISKLISNTKYLTLINYLRERYW